MQTHKRLTAYECIPLETNVEDERSENNLNPLLRIDAMANVEAVLLLFFVLRSLV